MKGEQVRELRHELNTDGGNFVQIKVSSCMGKVDSEVIRESITLEVFASTELNDSVLNIVRNKAEGFKCLQGFLVPHS